MDYEICNGPKYWVPKRSTGEVPVLPASTRRPMDYEPVSGPAYPIIKRKRVPRGVERLRDRRAPRAVAPEVLAEAVHAEGLKAEGLNGTGRTEANEGSEVIEKKVIGRPFGPKPR